jgi:alkylation response protein AidB-like acyl-CoA dehydrogenase
MGQDDLLGEVERIRPILEDFAEQAEAERRLPDPVYDVMIDAGLFRMLVPAALGGRELHPVEYYAVIEAIARIDSAAAWNLNQSASVASVAAWLPEDGAEEIYARGPDTVVAGGFYPPGPSVRVDGGWRVTARNAFASGCHRAEWFGVPLLEVPEDESRFDPDVENAPSIIALIPRDEVDVVDTWNTLGMRGTFSADVNVDDVFVPEHRIAYLGPEHARSPRFAGPLYAAWPWVGVHGQAVVSVGVAGAAIDKLIDLAKRKRPSYTRQELGGREIAQHHAARATALVDASRAYLNAAISEAYEEAARDGRSSEAAVMRCQLAASHATEACAEAVGLVHEVAGTSSIRIGRGIERHHRDVLVLTTHAYMSSERYEDVGKMLFGQPPDFWVFDL